MRKMKKKMNCYVMRVRKVEYSYAYVHIFTDSVEDSEIVAGGMDILDDGHELNFQIDDESYEIEEIVDKETGRLIDLESMYV